MAEIKERDLRDARDSIVADVADQARAIGVPVPDMQKIREFVDPIIHKVDVDARNEGPAPEPEQPDLNRKRDLVDGSRVQETPGGTVDVRSRELGKVTWNKGTGVARTDIPMTAPTALQLILNRLLQIPSWKAEFEQAEKICSWHLSPPKDSAGRMTCFLCERRERKFGELIDKARRQYSIGKRDKKIQVG